MIVMPAKEDGTNHRNHTLRSAAGSGLDLMALLSLSAQTSGETSASTSPSPPSIRCMFRLLRPPDESLIPRTGQGWLGKESVRSCLVFARSLSGIGA